MPLSKREFCKKKKINDNKGVYFLYMKKATQNNKQLKPNYHSNGKKFAPDTALGVVFFFSLFFFLLFW